MPTRHAAENSPLAFERHLSSPIYADRRPIPANIVAEKATGYRSPANRRLLFFLQALSVEQGGLWAASRDLANAFPEVLMNSTVFLGPKDQCALELAEMMSEFSGETPDLSPVLRQGLIDLCIDPGLDLDDFKKLPMGRNILESIEKLRLSYKELESARVVTTSLGYEVYDLLNQASSLGGITIIEAPAGSGKSYPAESWCLRHLGEVYFVTLSGITTRTNLMQKIALRLGMATSQRKASELQAKIEAFILRTKPFFVIDEAHFLWPQSKRITSNPELIDWLDTLVNMGARIALICTDQFARQKDRVEKQTAWTSDQFKHRVREHRILDGRTSLSDLELVASHLLSFGRDAEPGSWTNKLAGKPDADAVAMVALSANKSELPLSRVRAIVERARFFAFDRNGRDRVSLADIVASTEGQDRSELALKGGSKRASTSVVAAEQTPAPEPISALPRTEQMPRLSAMQPGRPHGASVPSHV